MRISCFYNSDSYTGQSTHICYKQDFTAMNKRHLFGLDDHLIDWHSLTCGVHRDVVAPFMALQAAAAEQGFELAIASGYRDFERQLAIWNAKARGLRPVLDTAGRPLDIARLDPWDLAQAILRWSALPGASRHHWGTDLDVYDSRAVAADYKVQLLATEVQGDGPFVPLHNWLDQRISNGRAEGFFRPYQADRGGIAPERWHLSYAPLSGGFQLALDKNSLLEIITSQPIELQDTIVSHMDEIYQRFVLVPGQLYPSN
jgi:LAS superfamily LD-carboxypeptidase LdcB